MCGFGVGLTLLKNQDKQNPRLLFKHLYKTKFSCNVLTIHGSIAVCLALWLRVLLVMVSEGVSSLEHVAYILCPACRGTDQGFFYEPVSDCARVLVMKERCWTVDVATVGDLK